MKNTIMIDASVRHAGMASPLLQPTAMQQGKAGSGQSYLDLLKSLAGTGETERKGKAWEAVPADQMSMDEYKEHIAAKLRQLPQHATRAQSVASVSISDDGWERMKSDPVYEEWVVATIQGELAKPDPWEPFGSSSYSVYRFGATQEAYSGETWGKDYPGDLKSYVLSELSDSSFLGGSLWLKIARRRQQAANEQALSQITASISRLQQLGLLGIGQGRTESSLQNAAFLMRALSYF